VSLNRIAMNRALLTLVILGASLGLASAVYNAAAAGCQDAQNAATAKHTSCGGQWTTNGDHVALVSWNGAGMTAAFFDDIQSSTSCWAAWKALKDTEAEKCYTSGDIEYVKAKNTYLMQFYKSLSGTKQCAKITNAVFGGVTSCGSTSTTWGTATCSSSCNTDVQAKVDGAPCCIGLYAKAVQDFKTKLEAIKPTMAIGDANAGAIDGTIGACSTTLTHLNTFKTKAAAGCGSYASASIDSCSAPQNTTSSATRMVGYSTATGGIVGVALAVYALWFN
jgi:hypothetical protein